MTEQKSEFISSAKFSKDGHPTFIFAALHGKNQEKERRNG
jgi:hypothetical protein